MIMSVVLLWQPSDCIDLFVIHYILCYSRKINTMMMVIVSLVFILTFKKVAALLGPRCICRCERCYEHSTLRDRVNFFASAQRR